MSIRIKQTHPIPSGPGSIVKLFTLLVIMTVIWHIKPLESLAASATRETVSLTQVEMADKPTKDMLVQPGQIESSSPLTTPITLTPSQNQPEETKPAGTVCPPLEDVELFSNQNILANNFVNTAANIAGVILPDSGLKERLNILLLGSDSRSGDKYGHADTMILLTVDPISKTAGLLSIPRDLWVDIPGYGENRINQAYRLGEIKGHPGGGPALAIETIQANLGTPVHHYVLVDFAGFKQIIDILGGIEICAPETIDSATYYGYVPEAINKAAYYSYVPLSTVEGDGSEGKKAIEGHETAETGKHGQNGTAPVINTAAETEHNNGYKFLYIEAGPHTLDGYTTLRYARSRASVTADFARVQRQQAILLAMRRKALQIGIIPKIPELWSAMSVESSHIVESDLQLTDIWQLAPLAYEIALADIRTGAISHEQTINHTTSSGARVLLPQRAEIKVLVDDMFGPSNPTALLTQAEIEVSQAEVEVAQAEIAHANMTQVSQIQAEITAQ